MNEAEAEEYTQSLGQIVAGSTRQIYWAKRNGIPEALGLSVEQWVNNRLGGYVKLSILERRELALEMEADGESTREIAKVLGVGHATVARDLKPVSNETDEEKHAADTNDLETDPVSFETDEEVKVKENHQHITSSESVEWYTPAMYVDAAREVMGQIDLDPASNDEANGIVKAGTYYTEETDGLSQEWFGNVWINPPYGSACRAFIERTITLKIEGRIDQAVILVNANSNDTGWFRPLWDHLLCFTYGRVNFYGPNGQESGPTHGSCFVYLGDRSEEFKRVFSKIGAVVKRA